MALITPAPVTPAFINATPKYNADLGPDFINAPPKITPI